MIQEYLYEIIAFIVFLTAIVVYFLTIKFQQEEQDVLENINSNKKEKNVLRTIHIDTQEEKTIPASYEEEAYALNGEEEGSFGNIKNNPFEEAKEQAPIIVQPQRKRKIDVPPHGKITKSNFTEFSGAKILVAEDNVINQKVISGLLANSGIEITMANDGQVVLDILEQNNDFNLILMDAHMPRLDGFQATREIRANPRYEHIVIVALSGDIATDDRRKMKDSGMEAFLKKPLHINDLYDVFYAYTKEESQSNALVDVVRTKALNGEQGLKVCGGDDEFYKDILHEFIKNYTNSSDELLVLLERNDLISADEMLLDFIGITANIGANTMQNIALELKEAIRDTQEKSYTILLEEYKEHLALLENDIKGYIE